MYTPVEDRPAHSPPLNIKWIQKDQIDPVLNKIKWRLFSCQLTKILPIIWHNAYLGERKSVKGEF